MVLARLRSEGTEVDFEIVPREDGVGDNIDCVTCYTTRVDTIYGCTYMAVAPEYPELRNLVKGLPQAAEVLDFVKESSKLTNLDREADEVEKAGKFTGR